MVRIELIGVPFDGYGRPGHQARAAAVLREVGLVEAFSPHDVLDGDDVVLPAPVASRGARTSLINEPALLAMIELLRHRVAASLRAGRFPVVIGADCTTLLGSVPASRAEGRRTKLLFVAGHEDTMPLDVSEDGEAANCEIGLLLGLTGRLIAPPLLDATSLLAPDDLVVLGTRDQAWRRLHNVGTLADVGVWCRTSEQVAQAPADLSRAAVRHLRSGARGTWWLHVDLDVLDPDVFTAQGLPGVPDEPGGLTWDQLRALTEAALSQGGCVGLSVAIYDPDQDPDRTDARKVVDWVGHMAHSLAVQTRRCRVMGGTSMTSLSAGVLH